MNSGIPTQAASYRRLALRLMPLLFAGYVIAYLDRANVAFANVALSTDLGFSRAVFGFGAGVFFLGYFTFQIPVSIWVERRSARRCIGGMLIVWGLCTIATAGVRTAAAFYLARFALGCAEAGFYPGVIVYLRRWFPERDRGRALALFVMAGPVALALGAPLSAVILNATWPVGAPWQWLFIVQGAPAVALGFVVLRYLPDWPRSANWLTVAERESLERALAHESPLPAGPRQGGWGRVAASRNTILLAGAHLLANVAGYAFLFWLPANLRGIGTYSPVVADAFAFVPYAAAIPALWFAARSSDRTGERKGHACVPMLVAAACMSLAAASASPPSLKLLLLTVTGAAIFAWIPGFWQLPAASLSREAAAAAIGIVNAVGNLGGFIGPFITGLLGSWMEPLAATALVMAGAYGAAALLVSRVSITASLPHQFAASETTSRNPEVKPNADVQPSAS